MTSPTPFKIHVSDDILAQTKRKLESARLPDNLLNVVWEGLLFRYLNANSLDGTPVSEVERLKNHWLNDYNWRTHEAKINELPQFTLPIDMDDFGEMAVHFVHKKALSRPNAIPLLFIHGWPGSFHEVKKILPLLTNPTNPDDPVFDVVAPRYPLPVFAV